MPIHVGGGFTLGQQGGEAGAHAHAVSEMPTHIHVAAGDEQRRRPAPSRPATLLAQRQRRTTLRRAARNLTTLQPAPISNVGGSQPHNNMQPFLALNFCIALQGIFPSQN